MQRGGQSEDQVAMLGSTACCLDLGTWTPGSVDGAAGGRGGPLV